MKTDKDIKRENVAYKMNSQLIYELGRGDIQVTAGGKRGPYSITINGLNQTEMKKLLRHILRSKI